MSILSLLLQLWSWTQMKVDMNNGAWSFLKHDDGVMWEYVQVQVHYVYTGEWMGNAKNPSFTMVSKILDQRKVPPPTHRAWGEAAAKEPWRSPEVLNRSWAQLPWRSRGLQGRGWKPSKKGEKKRDFHHEKWIFTVKHWAFTASTMKYYEHSRFGLV